MKITITGRNLSLTDGLKNGVEKKLGKLDKFFQAETPCNVTLSTQKDMQKIEVTIPVKGSVIRAEEATEDMYQSIDLVVDVLERQIRKYKNKLIQRHQAGSDFSSEFIDEKPAQDEEEIKIVRTKHIDLKPMTAEEACLQMELLGHSFFVFQDGNTGKVNVYKRKANSYGLIEPEE